MSRSLRLTIEKERKACWRLKGFLKEVRQDFEDEESFWDLKREIMCMCLMTNKHKI